MTDEDSSPRGRPLTVLRATIDAIDRDMLQLLARRMAIVGEIAEFKRDHHLAIRDLAREREVLDDRCARAERLGLSRGVIESIFRLLLLTSRDRQAALRAEVPRENMPRTVAVIGGRGGMGSCFARMFADLGHPVMISDEQTELRPVEAAASADVVVISVPIRATEEVIRTVGPHVREDALLMDLTSIKGVPVQAMLDASKASVVGAHPMFGPGVDTLQGQRVVLCPARGEKWAEWLRRTLAARGLVLTEATPEHHDRIMAVVQVLNHYQTQVLGLALSRLGVSIEDSLAFTSPAYLLETYVTARHFAQSPELYGPIEMLNPCTAEVTNVFRAAAEEIASILADRDQARFDAMFEEVGDFFGEFTAEALEQSRYLINRLIELTAGRSVRLWTTPPPPK